MLAVTERRLLWLLDDAPVGRVRSLAYRDVAAVDLRAHRLRRQAVTLSLRTTGAAGTASRACRRIPPRRSSGTCKMPCS